MHVDAAKFRQIEHLRTQDLPECRHHDQVRDPGPQLGHCFGITYLLRLDDWNAKAERGSLDSRWLQGPATPGGTIGLSHHACQQVMGCQCLQCRDGKGRGTHKNNAIPGIHAAILAYFQIFPEIGRKEHKIGCVLSEFVVK